MSSSLLRSELNLKSLFSWLLSAVVVNAFWHFSGQALSYLTAFLTVPEVVNGGRVSFQRTRLLF